MPVTIVRLASCSIDRGFGTLCRCFRLAERPGTMRHFFPPAGPIHVAHPTPLLAVAGGCPARSSLGPTPTRCTHTRPQSSHSYPPPVVVALVHSQFFACPLHTHTLVRTKAPLVHTHSHSLYPVHILPRGGRMRVCSLRGEYVNSHTVYWECEDSHPLNSQTIAHTQFLSGCLNSQTVGNTPFSAGAMNFHTIGHTPFSSWHSNSQTTGNEYASSDGVKFRVETGGVKVRRV